MLVYLAVVNACQAMKSRSIKFGNKWCRRVGVGRATKYRSLQKLRHKGVLTEIKTVGRSTHLTLSPHVPLKGVK